MTEEEFKSWYPKLSGTFQDGKYEYKITLVLDQLVADEPLIGVTIFIINEPDYIGPDLLKFALNHIIEAGKDSIKAMECKWFLSRVKVVNLPQLGDISNELFDSADFLTFNKFSYDILRNTKFFDLGHLTQTRDSKIRKMTKFMDYIVSTYTLPEEIQLENREHELTYKIQSEIVNSLDGPIVMMTISITLLLKDRTPFINGANSWKLYSDIQKSVRTDLMDKIHSMAPVNITNKDHISLDIKSAK